jgi:type I restriction enzyme, S subunit
MNPAQLLNHFDRISEAPDAIQRLRRFILDLAVRGKLVEQDPRDEPASELLKRIQVEKAQLAKQGTIKKLLDHVETPHALDFPSELPTGWAPAFLRSICISVTDGDHLPPPKADYGLSEMSAARP